MGDRPTLAALAERVRGWEKFQTALEATLGKLQATVADIHKGMATSAQVDKLAAKVDELERTVQAQAKAVEKVADLEETLESVTERVTMLELERERGKAWIAGALAVAGLVGGAVGFVFSVVLK